MSNVRSFLRIAVTLGEQFLLSEESRGLMIIARGNRTVLIGRGGVGKVEIGARRLRAEQGKVMLDRFPISSAPLHARVEAELHPMDDHTQHRSPQDYRTVDIALRKLFVMLFQRSTKVE